MQKRLHARARAVNIWLMAPLLGLAVFMAVFAAVRPAQAATSSYLNFQARLLSNTGAVVPDGSYNIDFKIYNADSTTGTVGSCTGACLWEETRTNAAGHGVTVINGYFSVNLGSVTSFPSINWDQPLWLTMNLTTNGTMAGAPTSGDWDGEMQNGGHSISLTALPYSFVAGQVAKSDGSGHRGTLAFNTVANNPAILLPDASGTVCLQTATACGFESTTGNDFIQNSAGGPQTANFNIQSAASGSIGAVIQGASGQTADLFDLKNSTTVFSVGNNGQTLFKPTASNNSVTFFQIQPASSSTPVFNVDTTDSFVGIGTAAPVAQLTVGTSADNTTAPDVANGDLVDVGGFLKSSTNTQEAFKTHVTVAPTADSTQTYSGGTFNLSANSSHVAGATFQGTNSAVSFSGTGALGTAEGAFYRVQNTSTGTITNAYGIQIATPSNSGTLTSTYGLYIASQTIGTQTNTPYGIYQAGSSDLNFFSGATTIKNASTSAFQVQNSSGNGVLTVDTSSNSGQGQIVLGKPSTNNGTIVFDNSAGTGTAAITLSGNPSSNYVYQLPTTSVSSGQCLQAGTVSGTNVPLTFGACGASGTFLNKNATDTSSADAGSGYLYTFTNSGSAGTGGVLKLDNGNNTGSTLSATTSGNPAAGKAVIYGQNTNASPSGNLLDLESGSSPSSKFSVDANGNVSLGGASPVAIQGSTTNGTLNLYANGTGTLALDTTGSGTISVGNTHATTINIGTSSVVSIITTQASGISQTITGSATAPSDVIKTTTNSTSAFQVQNSGSHSVLGVDTSNSQVVLGQANQLNGALLFQNSASSYGITLNSTGANSSYTLTLPTAAPAGGLCIETSPGSASQLIFASCSNNNASIQEVHYWDANSTNVISSVTPTTVGDEIVVTTQIPNSGVTVSGISGGGVTTWNPVVTSNGNGTVHRVEMWAGTVTSLTTSSITVTYTGGTASGEEVTATEFTAAGASASTSWGIESSSSLLNSTASTTVNYPNMTAVNGSELYIGYAQVQNPPAAGNGSTGFNYIQTSTQHNMVTYDPSLTANTAYQPTALQNSSGQSNTVAAILTAFVTSSSINNTTTLQKANFYVQAATSGTVAGVLQAASSGTADILDLRNSGASNVLSVGSTGNVTVQPAASASAFKVLNGSGYSVLGVDTSGNQVTLGDATHLSGKITFADSGDSNTISLLAPSTIASSYNLKLPNNTPSTGLCLATSPSDANQLIFSSCATQVSAASISYVNKWDSNGTGSTNPFNATITDSPSSVGDLLVVFAHAANNVTVNSVSGGGVTTWYKVTSYAGGGTPGNIEMWRGVVTATGANTVTINYLNAPGVYEVVAQEFTMGSANGTWAIDTSGTATSTTSVTTVNYPSLTPLNSNELYAGYAYGGGTMSAGTTTGFTYVATGASKYLAYKTNVSGGTPYQPTAPQTTGVYASIAAVIEAYTGTSVIVNTTSVQDANFNVQAATAGTVAGILQAATSGSADVFQVKDSTGNNVMSVNPTSGVGTFGLTLGAPNVSSGQIIFNSSGNSNYITITAPTTPGSSYQLILPSTTPAAGQCLATSPSNANQLVFSSCANQVTSISISYVNSWKSSGNNISTLNISPASLNNLIVFFSSPRNGVSLTGLSGCGITWSKVSGSTAGSGADTSAIDMYKGVVTATGSCTVTATFSGSEGNPNELAAMEFTTGTTTGSWVVDASNTQYNGTASTTMTFPSLTPQSSKDLYVGYGAGGTYSSGGSTGFTYLAGSLTNRVGLYNTSVSATTQPTATTSSSSSMTVGALVAAYSSSSVISNSTVTQQGNFNVQAATSGSVAGTLQAFAGGTGDIFDLLDGSGTLVGKVGYSGNMLVKPSTASAAAFQVQTTGSVNVLSVDTSGDQVVVGAGSTGESSPSLLVVDNETGTAADPTEVNGAIYYNATTHTFRCGVAGAWQNCGGLLYANTSKSSAISNCTNNCAAFSTAASIPANYCQAGKVIRLSANGYFSSQASATNIQFGVYYGTDASVASNDVLIGSVSPAVSVTSASNNYFQINMDINCFSTTSMQAGGILGIQAGSAAAGLTTVPINSTNAATVVSSSTKNLYIFPIWSAASASNTATLAQLGVNSP